MPKFLYSIEHIKQALTTERLGGICYFSICGAGETLLPKETLQITKALLENGHYVNITNNGTITNRLQEIATWPSDLLDRLQLAFSFHYLELKKHNKIDLFFNNVRMVRSAGASILVQLNLYDGYNDFCEDIKQICIDQIGAPPQLAATRDESTPKFKFHTKNSDEDYYQQGKIFHSPLWEFTMRNFNFKHSKEFCYAGEWSGTLNLSTGEMSGCYGQGIKQNIFEDLSKPIRFRAIGKGCCNKFCMNSSHFLSLGCIPTYESPTYLALRNRDEANWYSATMKRFLNEKLGEINKPYSLKQKFISNISSICSTYRIKQILVRIKWKIIAISKIATKSR